MQMTALGDRSGSQKGGEEACCLPSMIGDRKGRQGRGSWKLRCGVGLKMHIDYAMESLLVDLGAMRCDVMVAWCNGISWTGKSISPRMGYHLHWYRREGKNG